MKITKKIVLLLLIIVAGYFIFNFFDKTRQITYSFTEFDKSKSDARQYKYIELKNGLRAFLVSDQNTDKAAASMRVFAGFYDTPKDGMGVPHFTEHMLFLGNKKYPEPNFYQEYIGKHGGSTNAYTTLMETVYYFDVSKDSLSGALDIFSQFFISPLFTAKYIDKEKNAVDSEYKMNFKNDFWRRTSVDQETANPEHPHAYFYCGNLETLSSDDNFSLRNKVMQFYNKYYFSKNMVLTLVGPYSLDELQKMALEYFSGIPESGQAIEDRSYANIPIYRENDLAKIINLKSEDDGYQMYVSFPIDNAINKYQTSPEGYISNLLSRRDQKSLYDTLINAGYINNIYSWVSELDKNNSILYVAFDMTENGRNEYEKIVNKLFAFINLIKAEGVNEWRFQEMQAISQTAFDFVSKEPPIWFAVGLSKNVNDVPLKHTLTAERLKFSYSREDILSTLSKLVPDNMRIVLSSKQEKTNKQEKYYKVPYSITKIAKQNLHKWSHATDDSLELRKKNPYIAENVHPVYQDKKQNDEPVKIHQDSSCQIWCLADRQFALPEIDVKINLFNDNLNKNIQNSILSDLYVTSLNEHLHRKYADAMDALNYLFVSGDGNKLHISITSYSMDITTKLVREVSNELERFIPTENRFIEIKNQFIRQFKNNEVLPPYQYAFSEAKNYLIKGYWQDSEKAKHIENLQYTDMLKFISLSKKATAKEAIIYGGVNCNSIKKDIVNSINAGLNSKMVYSFTYKDLVTSLPARENNKLIRTRHADSAVLQIYLSSKRDVANIAKFILLGHILEEPFHTELRTEKQLGYVMHASGYGIHDVMGLFYIGQSATVSSKEMLAAFEAFIQKSSEKLFMNMSDDDFMKYKKSLRHLILKQPDNRHEVLDKIVKEIYLHRYDFNRREKIAMELEKISKKELSEFYKKITAMSGVQKLVLHT